ncbi:hypothetical protein ACFYSJ_04500 [Streptomyces sp. NPDC005248]|uniref:hypothetical protein n=1 Tax=unclassified Streptomyces TaxID=2593676 RepID=UPI0036AFE49C
MNNENRALTWLGIAAGVITVLGFFGITNYDAFRNAVNPADIACHRAIDAVKAAGKGSPETSGPRIQIMVEQIRQAAKDTDDLTLQALLQAYADSHELHGTDAEQQTALDELWHYCKDKGAT